MEIKYIVAEVTNLSSGLKSEIKQTLPESWTK